MSIIIRRSVKGSALTSGEIDSNVNNLNNDKVEVANSVFLSTPSLVNNLIPLANTVLPSIYPSLNLDFANSKTLDPRITFTRNTSATYYDGKTVALAEQNLFQFSQGVFTNTGYWLKTGVTQCTVVDNNAVAPDGTTTASTVTVISNATMTPGAYFTIESGKTYTVSLWVKLISGTGDFRFFSSAASNSWSPYKTATATWQRFDWTFTTSSTNSYFRIMEALVANDVFHIWGAQLEQRSSVSAYTPTTSSAITNYIPKLMTAPSNVARFDHDPITKKSLGLLVEEARTNLVSYSNAIGNTSLNWAFTNAVITLNTLIAPDGTLTATKLAESNTNSTHRIFVGVGTIPGSTYTHSVYAKAGENSFLLIKPGSNATNSVLFNLILGTIVVTGGTDVVGIISSVGNGWYRCSVTNCSDSYLINTMYYLYKNGKEIYIGDGYSGIYLWGATVELSGTSQAIRISTANTGSTNTNIVLDSGASATANVYAGNRLALLSGGGSIIASYDSTTKIATLVNPLSYVPVSGDPYTITPATMIPSGFPTSYMPTGTGTFSRVADSTTITGTAFTSWFNQGAGSWYCEIDFLNNIRKSATRPLSSGGNGNSGWLLTLGSTGFSGIQKYALSYANVGAGNQTSLAYLNSVLTGSYANYLFPYELPIMTYLNIGSGLNNSNMMTGHIRKVTFYPAALSAQELQGLSS